MLADVLGELTPDQQETQSLCDAWTVRRVAGHLIVPMQVGIPRFAVAMMRHRGDFDRANDSLSRAQATRPFDEIVRTLRDKADSRFTPPGQGPEAPLTDIIVHGLDITWPLGLSHTVDAPQAVRALDHVAAGRGRFTSLLDGHRLEASDLDWCHGVGPTVTGPAAALLLGLTGRRAGLEAVSTASRSGSGECTSGSAAPLKWGVAAATIPSQSWECQSSKDFDAALGRCRGPYPPLRERGVQ